MREGKRVVWLGEGRWRETAKVAAEEARMVERRGKRRQHEGDYTTKKLLFSTLSSIVFKLFGSLV